MIRAATLRKFLVLVIPAAFLLASGESTPASAVTGEQVVATARRYIGVPYKWGASISEAPRVFDCTSFTKYVFGIHGIWLPRTHQMVRGTPAPLNALRAGDLLFFDSTSKPGIDHVGIYMGGNQVIHTYKVGIGVCIRGLFGTFWGRHLVMARRVISPGPVQHPPIGRLDAVSNGRARGWALDPDAPTLALPVHFYIDGPVGRGGVFIGAATARNYRPDVNRVTGYPGNHGFSFALPPQFRDGRTHALYAYAIDTAGGINPLLTASPKSFVWTPPSRPPIGFLDIVSGGVAQGWALDPDAPAASISVHVYVDGRIVGAASANVPRPDVNRVLGVPGNHGFTFALPAWLRDGRPHTLHVYGIDLQGGLNPLLSNAPKVFVWAP